MTAKHTRSDAAETLTPTRGAVVGSVAGALYAVAAGAIIAWRYREHILPPAAVSQTTFLDPITTLLGGSGHAVGGFGERFYSPGLLAKLPLVAELLVVNVLLGAAVGLLVGASVARRRASPPLSALRVPVFVVGFLSAHLLLSAGALVPWVVDQRRSHPLRHYIAELGRQLVADGVAAELALLGVAVLLAFGIVRRLGPAGSLRTAMGGAVAACVVALVGGTSAPTAAVEATPPPPALLLSSRPRHVVLISIDSLRADHLPCYGYHRATSPSLDAVAADGVRFASAYSVSSWTLPSHASMLTGLNPLTHGAVTAERRLAPHVPTLATELGRAGYVTAGFVSYEFLRRRYGFDAGFDHYDDFTTDRSTEAEERSTRTGPLLNSVILPWIDAHTQDRFFLFIHYFDVHWDYDPPAPYDTMFDTDYAGPDLRPFLDNPAIHSKMPRRQLEHLVALYDGEIRFTDQVVGEVLAALDRHGIARDTLLIVTADHGDEFFEHGDSGHTKTLYDEVIRVPLLVRWPRVVAAGRTVETPVSLVDVAPTVYDLTGVSPPLGMEGRSIAPLVLGRDAPPVPIYAHLTGRKRQNNWAMVRAGDDKYLQQLRLPHAELYDLAADPTERRNRFADPDARPRRLALADSLLGWLRQQWSNRQALRPDDQEIVIDRHNTERLRALGYVE